MDFKAMARINSKFLLVANVTADLGVEWLGNHIVNEKVADAMDKLILSFGVRLSCTCGRWSHKADICTWSHPCTVISE